MFNNKHAFRIEDIFKNPSLFLLLLLLPLQFGLFGLFFFKKLYFYALIILALYFLVFAFSVYRSLLLALFIIVVFQEPRYQFEYMPIGVSQNIVLLLLLPIIYYWIIDLLSGKTERKANSKLCQYFTGFLIVILLAFAVGLLNGYDWQMILENAIPFCYYITFFIVYTSLKEDNDIKMFSGILLAAGTLVIFQYIFSFLTGRFSILSMGRIVTGQIHILYLILAFMGSMILNLKQYRYCSILFFILLIPPILISQTRGTWAASIVAILVNIVLHLRVRKYPLGKFMAVFLVMAGFLFLSFFIAQSLLGMNMLSLVQARAETVMNWQQDTSLMMRAEMYHSAWKEFLSSPFIGRGLGSLVHVHDWQYQLWIDSSYMVLMWKMGIIGLISYLAIMLVALNRSYQVFIKTEKSFYQWFSGGFFSAFSGFMVLGFISPVLLKYRFNIIWAILFACIEYMHMKVVTEVKTSSIR